jgi:hypothetical protein
VTWVKYALAAVVPSSWLPESLTPLQLQVVLLDHGLYIDESPAFKQQYARLWKAIFGMDIGELKAVSEVRSATCSHVTNIGQFVLHPSAYANLMIIVQCKHCRNGVSAILNCLSAPH